MNIDDQDDLETKEWEDALSLVENIFKDFKENSADSDEPNSDLLDVARWKVVWGKKPAQYRLKPFLMWSVDEMPSIPEECESSSEALVAEEVNEIIKIKKDKQLRFLKRKMFKMKRRIDDINVLLAKTLSDDAVASLREEDPTKVATILQLGAQRVELINERNIIREKLRKFNKKLMTFKGPALETNGISGERQDVGDALRPTDAFGTNADEHMPSQSDLHAGEPWSFKSCRRSAIKKDGKSTWNKPQPKEMPRSSCDITVDKKYRKKRCCKGHHKRQETKDGEEAVALERQALSESDLTSGASERGEMCQQKHFGTYDGSEKGNKYDLRTSRSSEHHKELTTERGTRGKDRMPSVRSAQDIGSGSRGPRPRRNICEGTALRHDREAATSNTSGPQTQGNHLRTGLKKDMRTIRSSTDVGAEEQKQSQESAKHCWRSKRSSSTKDGRTVRTYTRSKPVDKDFTPKSRNWKCTENASRVDQPEVSGKRIPISNVSS